MALKPLEQRAITRKDAHAMITRRRSNQISTRMEHRHLDVVVVAVQHRLQRQAGNGPHARSVVTRRSDESGAVRTERAMINQMVVRAAAQRTSRLNVPQN